MSKLNLDKLRGKLENINESSTPKQKILWKPSAKKHIIRAFPYQHFTDGHSHDEDFFIELYFHYVGNKSVVCLERNYGDKCPYCEYAESLHEEAKNAGGDKQIWKSAKNTESRMRTFLPIVEMEKGKVKRDENGKLIVGYWGFGATVHKQLLTAIVGAEGEEGAGDIADPKTGRNIIIDWNKDKGDYGELTVTVSPNISILTSDKAELSEILNSLPPIEERYKREDYDTLLEQLSKLNNTKDEDDKEIPSTNRESESESEDLDDEIDSKIDDVLGEIENSEDILDEK